MLNIVVPMAGRGSRFANAGYKLPKPLVDVSGRPMIEWVVKNITPDCAHRFLFICQKEHCARYGVDTMLAKISPGCVVLTVEQVTEGAACTVLLAEDYINNSDALMIANSDQYLDIDINQYLESMRDCEGMIMTMPANDPKWSFIKRNQEGLVTLVREKEVISDEGTVGVYNYAHGSEFVKYAHRMIEKNIRVNNEFYVAPVYNEMIHAGFRIKAFNIGEHMYGLGTPEDLKKFLSWWNVK